MNQNDTNYLELNKDSWNKRLESHMTSEFYNVEDFKKGMSSLNSIELDLLGDIKGKSILHLQCHFGQDTMSLARMGAQCTGVDLSDKSIDVARNMSAELGLDCDFMCCDLYDLPNHLNKQYDYVFTSYGTIIWLPDINKWAKTIKQFLKPTGQFVFVDFHPVVWMFDDNLEKVGYNYFGGEPIIENESGTYAEPGADITSTIVTWNHTFSEILMCLTNAGMEITDVQEYDYSPYDCFKNLEKIANRKYQIKHYGNKFPLVMSICASPVK